MAEIATLLGTQNADHVDIRGGTISGITWSNSVISTGAVIDSATIGGTTPGAGTFTTLIGTTIDGVIGSVTPAAAIVTTLQATGLIRGTAASGITASTTQTLAAATALTNQVSIVGTVANASDAVGLRITAVGQWQDVYNAGANAAGVFPQSASHAIDGGSAGAAVTLTNTKRARFTMVATNTIVSAQLGVISA